jgi:hypothetical protein
MVGDVVVHFTEESAFSGCKLVIEAKHDRSYTVAKSLEELETARKNRGASVGLFVMSSSHAPMGYPSFARYALETHLQNVRGSRCVSTT